jgi:flagellar biosynthesis chaperone FliJ
MRWLVERRLRSSSAQLAAARAELRTLDEQVMSLADDASELDTRAAVDGLGQTAYEHRRAQGQVDTINRERARLRTKIEALEARQDDLLDALNRAGNAAR